LGGVAVSGCLLNAKNAHFQAFPPLTPSGRIPKEHPNPALVLAKNFTELAAVQVKVLNKKYS